MLGNLRRIPIAADRPREHHVESIIDPEPPSFFRRLVPAPIVGNTASDAAPVALSKLSADALGVCRCPVAIVETESPDRHDGPIVLASVAVRVREFQIAVDGVSIITQYPLGQILAVVAGNVVHDVERAAATPMHP